MVMEKHRAPDRREPTAPRFKYRQFWATVALTGTPRETHNTSWVGGRGPEGEAALQLNLEGHKESALGGGEGRTISLSQGTKVRKHRGVAGLGTRHVCFSDLQSVAAISLTLRVIHPDPGEGMMGSKDVVEVGSGEVPQLP